MSIDTVEGVRALWLAGKRLTGASPVHRVMAKVIKDHRGCWLFVGSRWSSGYGKIVIEGRNVGAHRVMYEAWFGKIPEGLTIDHLCRTTECVNPNHLEAVAHRENVLRGVSPAAKNAVKTHCIAGHALTEDNIYRRPNGRQCRKCTAARKQQPKLAPVTPPPSEA